MTISHRDTSIDTYFEMSNGKRDTNVFVIAYESGKVDISIDQHSGLHGEQYVSLRIESPDLIREMITVLEAALDPQSVWPRIPTSADWRQKMKEEGSAYSYEDEWEHDEDEDEEEEDDDDDEECPAETTTWPVTWPVGKVRCALARGHKGRHLRPIEVDGPQQYAFDWGDHDQWTTLVLR